MSNTYDPSKVSEYLRMLKEGKKPEGFVDKVNSINRSVKFIEHLNNGEFGTSKPNEHMSSDEYGVRGLMEKYDISREEAEVRYNRMMTFEHTGLSFEDTRLPKETNDSPKVVVTTDVPILNQMLTYISHVEQDGIILLNYTIDSPSNNKLLNMAFSEMLKTVTINGKPYRVDNYFIENNKVNITAH